MYAARGGEPPLGTRVTTSGQGMLDRVLIYLRQIVGPYCGGIEEGNQRSERGSS
ncbi:MAG: hypothetical protein ACREKR_13080 [Candidatus Methylomirabilales bacterium]